MDTGSGGGLLDQLGDLDFIVVGHTHPHALQSVGDLTEEFMDHLEALNQHKMHLDSTEAR